MRARAKQMCDIAKWNKIKLAIPRFFFVISMGDLDLPTASASFFSSPDHPTGIRHWLGLVCQIEDSTQFCDNTTVSHRKKHINLVHKIVTEKPPNFIKL